MKDKSIFRVCIIAAKGMNMDKNWNEIFAKFLLDIAKIVFTTLVIGKIVGSQIVSWWMFAMGIIFLIGLIVYSRMIFKNKEKE